ncbi:MAG: glycogen-binding domain-containing protein [bacterium]|nr:glycogen-binding domain-containing protein [bacterium]
MKKFIIILLLITGCATLKYIAPRSQKPHKVDMGILFEYYAPSAQRVTLAGEFNNWEFGNSEKAIQLQKKEDGIWWAVVPLQPGRYKYKFVIDDTKWEGNPNGESANDTDGNSLIVVE